MSVTSFRSKESTCPLAYVKQTSTWISGDDLGTVYQALPTDKGKMNELGVVEECSIVAIATCPIAQECAVGKENEVDVCALPSLDVTSSMIVRRDQPVTHVEYDNDGGHM